MSNLGIVMKVSPLKLLVMLRILIKSQNVSNRLLKNMQANKGPFYGKKWFKDIMDFGRNPLS